MICETCKWADWKRTKAGRLHPSGSGYCTYRIEIILPAAFYWIGSSNPSGGYLNRHKGGKWQSCPRYEEAKT